MDPNDDPKPARAALDAWVRALRNMKELETGQDRTLLSLVDKVAGPHGNKVALSGEHESLTYRELVQRSARYALWALEQDLGAGDVVVLLMPNCPDYVAFWLGLTQVGCTVALINTNLVGDALAHCINVAEPKVSVVAGCLLERVTAIAGRLPVGTALWVHGDSDVRNDLPRIDVNVAGLDGDLMDVPRSRLPSARDRALLIYTSGTTGLPKAAKVSHARVLEWSCWFAGMMDAQPSDRMYDCLPMYHSTGGVVAIGSMLVRGGSVLIRSRFSSSQFWDDVVGGDCTIFQYIGELCRYLVQSAPHPLETAHRLRLCSGNGLRGDVWERFQRRFRIPQILEFYAATEGNVSLYNCDGKPGAIGRIPTFLAHRFPVELISCDTDTGEPLRNAAGLCIRCGTDEPGEAIGQIVVESSSAARHFDGYTDAEASDRKILHSVFVAGDRWFRTGDLMRRDKAGYYYFIDRIGDTFRWKGENVSTTEVAAVIAACPGVTDAVVYGVTVPGMEGQAGMAAITTDEQFSFGRLAEHLRTNLPDYACPVFVRLCREIGMTGTFKLTKGSLAREGVLPSGGSDTVWFRDRRRQAYVRYDALVLGLIQEGVLQP